MKLFTGRVQEWGGDGLVPASCQWHGVLRGRAVPYVFSVVAAPVAQTCGTCSLSVSVQIVAGRDDFAERGSVSRSTLKAIDALDLSKRRAGQGPAGHRPALLWLRLRRAALYRRFLTFLTCQLPPASKVLPITNRRYGRLKTAPH